MTAPTPGWHRGQSEYCRIPTSGLGLPSGGGHCWKAGAMFSWLHRANYWLAMQTGRAI